MMNLTGELRIFRKDIWKDNFIFIYKFFMMNNILRNILILIFYT